MQEQKNNYHFFEHFTMRCPLLPLNAYNLIPTQTRASLESLKPLWELDFFKNALFSASPHLYQLLNAYFEGKKFDTPDEKKLQQTFLKYFIRSTTRCTPFGFFAGTCLGKLSKQTDIQLKQSLQYQKRSHLDGLYLQAIIDKLHQNKVVQEQLLFFTNTTLYEAGGAHRYMERRGTPSGWAYEIQQIELSPFLKETLSKAEKGISLPNLVRNVVKEGVPKEEAKAFAQGLVENQLLVSRLQLTTNVDSLESLIQLLKPLKNVAKIVASLQKTQSLLKELSQTYTKDYLSTYKRLEAQLPLKKELLFKDKNLLQTDLFVTTNACTLSKKYVQDLRSVLPLLNKLNAFQENKNLSEFKNAFLKRYEGRKIPLLKALDVESGIGYCAHRFASDTSPFLKGLTVPERSTDKHFTLTEVEQLLHQKFIKTLRSNSYELVLEDNDFKDFPTRWDDLPDTFSLFTEIVEANDTEKLVIKSAGGTSAANLLARFGQGTPAIAKQLQAIADMEATMHSDGILAAVLHIPGARTSNVLKRPHLRAAEITCMTPSILPNERQIPLNDLFVCVENNEIKLYSKKLEKEVFPKLTSAHNYSKSNFPIYLFLCDLQKQKLRTSLHFQWPSILESQSFLPRVTYKNQILSKAQWVISKSTVSSFLKADDKALLVNIKKWREERQIPQKVLWTQYDQALLIDLENVVLIRLWLDSVKNKTQSTLQEFLPPQEGLVTRDEDVFANEFIFFCYNKTRLHKA